MKRYLIFLFAILMLATSCLTLDDSSGEIDLEKLKSVIEESGNENASAEFEIPEPDGNIDDALESKYNAIAEPVSDENASLMFEEIKEEVPENDNTGVVIIPSTEEKINELINKSLEEDASATINEVVDENGNFVSGTTQTLTPLKFDIAENLLEKDDSVVSFEAEPVSEPLNVSEETLRVDPTEASQEEDESLDVDVSEEPRIRWEDEVYTPSSSSISSGPVSIDNTRDILDEYNQFLAELGDDYKEAESVDNEDIEPVEEKVEDEEEWEEVAVADTESVEKEEESSKDDKAPSKVLSFFSNLWSDFKELVKGVFGKIKAIFSKK